jgi:formylglycine-generating enzyme required for sulfatase activity
MGSNAPEYTSTIWADEGYAEVPDYGYPYDPLDGRELPTTGSDRVVRDLALLSSLLAAVPLRIGLSPDEGFEGLPTGMRLALGVSPQLQPAVVAFDAEDWEGVRSSLPAQRENEIDDAFALYLLKESYYRPAVIAFENEDWETARTELEELVVIDSDYKDAQQLLKDSYYLPAVAALDARDMDTARFLLSKVLVIDPDDSEARELFAGLSVTEIAGATYVYVPAGRFTMGSNEGQSKERPVHEVYLDSYWIGQTEVTNAQYAACVSADACTEPSNSRWDNPNYADRPVVDVDWFQANEYAQWVGGVLPTEAQWEKACRGTEAFTYPWGNDNPTSRLLNYDYNVNTTTPVGSYLDGASPYGALDMAGNVWEWTADWYDSDYYRSSPDANPTGPSDGADRVLRGGAFYEVEGGVRCAYRVWYHPYDWYYGIGFRVVVVVSPFTSGR